MSRVKSGFTGKEPSPGLVFPVIEGEDPWELVEWLEALVESPVALQFTNNRSTMLSWRREQGKFRVRIHRMFVEAPEPVWVALAHYWVHEDSVSGKLIDAFISEHGADYARPVPSVKAIGEHHDLLQLFDALNERFFHNRCRVQITWGKSSPLRRGVRSRKSIQLGAYIEGDRLIRIHPCLDQSFVPNYYVAWVIFHEMLHEVLGVLEVNGKRQVHPPEFVVLEESYPDFERCKAWEKKHLGRLLKYRPR